MGATVENITQADPRDGLSGPVLLVKLNKQTLARYPLEGFRTIAGRSSECDIVLDGSSHVSRNHAQLLLLDNEVVVEDLGSRNGLYVNRVPCKRCTLQPGDRIGIGPYRLHLLNCQPRPNARSNTESDSVREIAELFRLWRNAAVTSTEVDSVMLGLPEKTGEVESVVDRANEECREIDESRSAVDCDVADNAGLEAVDARQLGLSTFVRPVDEQDQMMEKAARLVGQGSVDAAGMQSPVPVETDPQAMSSSLGSRLRRRLTRRRNLTR